MPKLWTKLAVFLLVASVAAAGCGKPQTDGTAAGSALQERPMEAAIKIYFGNEQGQQLVERTARITYNNAGDKYLATLNALRSSPDPMLVPLFSGITFRSAELKERQLTVDLSVSKDGQWGAPGEELTLQALKRTVFQFPEVDRLVVLVDGRKVESLMGHVDLPYPIYRNG